MIMLRFQIVLSKVVQVDVVCDSGYAEAEAKAIRQAKSEYGGADMDCQVDGVERIQVEVPATFSTEQPAQ